MYRSIAESISRKISGIRACETMRIMPKSSAIYAIIKCARGSAQQRVTGGMLSHSIGKQAMNWHINRSLNGRGAVPVPHTMKRRQNERETIEQEGDILYSKREDEVPALDVNDGDAMPSVS